MRSIPYITSNLWLYQFTHKHLHVIYSEKALNELLPLAHKIYFKVHLYASYSHVIEAETINKVQILFSAPSSCTTMCVA